MHQASLSVIAIVVSIRRVTIQLQMFHLSTGLQRPLYRKLHLSTDESVSGHTVLLTARTASYSVAAVKRSHAWLLAALKGSLR